MPRPSSFRAALAGLLALGFAMVPSLAGPGTASATATAAARATTADPLVVHLDSITAVLPRTGSVDISGTVTNVSDETFTRINLHAFSSATPIPDSRQLADAALSDPTIAVGERVTTPGTFYTVDQLAPGETASFSDSVPVGLLQATGDPGVYWIGVHALGDSTSTPRDEIADGRARTFIPARPTGNRTQEASVMLSIRSRVWFKEDGSLAGTERWARRLAPGGSLSGVLDMADSAGSTPYSFLVDPSVLVALVRLTQGNPPRNILPDPTVEGQAPSPTATPSDGETATPETLTPQAESTEEPSPEEAALAEAAQAWLDRFLLTTADQQVLTLPFGDLDVSAAMRNDPTRYDEATARSADVMSDLGVDYVPTVAPSDDVLSPEAIEALPEDTVILMGDTSFTVPPDADSSVVRLLGHKVIVTSTGAESGGPGPTAATDPLALRQRLISEAALRAGSADPAPLVVTLPTVWRGEDAASFFDDLEQPWLELVPVSEVAAQDPTFVSSTNLAYTQEDLDAELEPSSFTAATRATDDATLLEGVLTLQTTIERQVRDEVLATLSELHRPRPVLARAAADRISASLRAELAKIAIEAPTAVTLSSDSGPLGVTLVNGLDQPVEVQVAVSTDGELTLSGASGARTLGPGARSVLRYEASTTQDGVHNVRLAVTSVDGVPLGSSDQLPIRAARVSALIWIVMAVGALVLFGMIGYRLPGQIRARRAGLAAAAEAPDEDEPHDEADPDTDPDTESGTEAGSPAVPGRA